MWATILGALGTLGVMALGGIGYVWKRKFERRGEQESLAIEESRVRLLAEASGLVDKLEPADRERAAPVLVAALQASLLALSERPEGRKKEGAGSQLLLAGATSTSERRIAAGSREFDERMARIDAQFKATSDAFEQRHQQFWIDHYRIPLGRVAQSAMVYSFQAAEQFAKVNELIGFKEAWETFKDAAFQWEESLGEDEEAKAADPGIARNREAIAGLKKRLLEMFDMLAAALKQRGSVDDGVSTERPAAEQVVPRKTENPAESAD